MITKDRFDGGFVMKLCLSATRARREWRGLRTYVSIVLGFSMRVACIVAMTKDRGGRNRQLGPARGHSMLVTCAVVICPFSPRRTFSAPSPRLSEIHNTPICMRLQAERRSHAYEKAIVPPALL